MSFFTYHMKFSSDSDIGGKNLITLKPNDTDKSTTLVLPGHSKTNYGEFYNQNLMFLMEHFSKYSPPENPTIGQIWYQPFELELLSPSNPILAGAPNNPYCGQYYDVAEGCTNGGGCVPPYDVSGYGIVNYPDNSYISSELNLDGRIMWSCDHNSWVRRKYTQKLRIFTDTLLHSDPIYPGWSLIETKLTNRPSDPECGDIFYDKVGLNYAYVTNTNASGPYNNYESLLNIHKDKTHVWNCGLEIWDILATERWTEDMYVNVRGDTMTGHLTLSGDPIQPLHAATKQYVDTMNKYDWDAYYSTRAIPYDNTITPGIDDHPDTDKTGKKYWDTLYKRNGILEVNNIYWRNITTDVKDHINCVFSKIFEMGFLSTPESRRANPNIFYDWVLDRDKEFFYHFGFQPVSYAANIDLIQTANYSNDAGVGGMLGYKMSINLNNSLQDYLRNELDDPNYTLHQEDFGTTGNPGKFRVLTNNPIVKTEGVPRSDLPQITRTTGYVNIFSTDVTAPTQITHTFDAAGNLTSITPYTTHDRSFWTKLNPHTTQPPIAFQYSRPNLNSPWVLDGIVKITNNTTGTYVYPSSTLVSDWAAEVPGEIFHPLCFTYPGTTLQLCAWDYWWMIDNFGPNYYKYSGPSNYIIFARNILDSNQIKCFANGNLVIDTNLTEKIYEDAFQRRRIEIYINDNTTGTLVTYHIRYYKDYYITGDSDPVSAPIYVSHPSTTPMYVKFMARIYAVWGYNSHDICHLLYTSGQPSYSAGSWMWANNTPTTNWSLTTKYIVFRNASGYYGHIGTTPGGTSPVNIAAPANNGQEFDVIYQEYNLMMLSTLHQVLGLYMLTSGTSPALVQSVDENTFVTDSNGDGINETGVDINGDEILTPLHYNQFKYYLRWIGYTHNVQFEVILENDAADGYLNETGEVKCTFKLKSGSIGYSYFPANLMIKKATTDVTYQMFPTIGYKTSTDTYETIIDPTRIIALCPDWY